MIDWLMTGVRGVLWVGASCLALLLAWIVLAFVWGVVGPWVRIAWLIGVKVFGRFFDALWNLTETSKRLAGRFEKWAKLGVAVGTLSLLCWPAPSPAAEPTPTPAVTTEGLSGAGTIFTDTGEQVPMFWARIETRYRAGRLQIALRLDGSSERGDVSLENPTTVQTLEGFALGSFRVLPAVAVAGAIGATRPVIGTAGPWRRTWVAGPLLGTRDRYVLLGVGEREPVAPGLLAMAAFRWQMRERTGVFGDLAARQVRDCTPDGVCGPPRLGYQLRVSVAVTAFGGR